MGNFPPAPPLSTRSKEILQQYKIDEKMIKNLWPVFYRLCKDEKSYWDEKVFLEFLKQDEFSSILPPLKVLTFVGSSNYYTLNFEDFLVVLGSFCAMTQEELLQFLFICVDLNGDGKITKNEFLDFFSFKTKGRFVYPKNVVEAIQGCELDLLNFENFVIFCENFPLISFMIFQLQIEIRRNFIGSNFWKKFEQERLKIAFKRDDSDQLEKSKVLSNGDVIFLYTPGRLTMKEFQEFVNRKKTLIQINNGRNSAERDTFSHRLKDEKIARSPLPNLFRNPISMYYVPFSPLKRKSKRAKIEREIGQEKAKLNFVLLEEDEVIKEAAELSEENDDF